MREFEDEQGRKWIVGVGESEGLDYKGRFRFEARLQGGGEADTVALEDVRWNSEKSARKTLETMSTVELRRRVAWARGRAAMS